MHGERLIPVQNPALARWGAGMCQYLLKKLLKGQKTDSERARLYSNLGVHLVTLGRREEALEAAQSANEVYERLAADNPAAYEPALAMSLNNLGNIYRELGQRVDSLKAAEKAKEIYERLAADNPAAHEPLLAMNLNDTPRALHCGSRTHDLAPGRVVVIDDTTDA